MYPKYKRKFSSHTQKIDGNINVTPFVDVVLVLLLIFMLTAPMLNKGFDVSLPKVKAKQVLNDDKEVIIFTIDKSGRIRIDDKIIAIKQVASYLNKYDAKKSQIFIKADKETNYGGVLSLMSTIHTNGFNNVSLITDPKES